MKTDKRCAVCNNYFTPCDCTEQALGWRKVVCCKEHFLHLLPIIEYTRNQKTKIEAKQELLLLEPIEYNDNVSKVVNEIMEAEKIEEEVSIEAEVEVEEVTYGHKKNKKR